MITLREIIRLHDNDYSELEPFDDPTPQGVSVIIPIYGAPDLLKITLETLARQSEVVAHPREFEVIVVDDGSPGGVEQVVSEVELPCLLRCKRHDDNRGISAARNTGLIAADRDLTLFMDSDVFLPDGFFVEQWKVHNAAAAMHASVLTVAFGEKLPCDIAYVEEYLRAHPHPNIEADFRYATDGQGRYPPRRAARLLEETNCFKTFPVPEYALPEMVVGHNMTCRRLDARYLGGFDEGFGTRWGLEDTEFGARAIQTGMYVIPVLSTGIYRASHPPRTGRKRSEDCLVNTRLYNDLLDAPIRIAAK